MVRKKGVIGAIMAAVLLIGATGTAFAAPESADSLDDAINKGTDALSDAQDEKKQLQSNLSAAQAMKKELETAKTALTGDVVELDSQMSEVSNDLLEVQNLLDTKEAELEKTTKELAQAKIDVEKQYEDMKLRIKFMYENGTMSYIQILLSSGSFSELLNKAEYIEQVSEYDRNMLQTYQDNRDKITRLEKDLKDQKEVLEQVKGDVEAKQTEMAGLISDKQTEIEGYESDIQNKEEAIKEYEAMIAEQDSTIKALEASVAAAKAKRTQMTVSDNSTNAADQPHYGGGAFVWPAPSYTRISDDYGYRTHPILGIQKFHSGVDMAAPSGSSILAAADGTVVAATYNATMGNYVMIDHGNGLYTIYMHASALYVSSGQSVSAGSTIAAVGSTGRSTGAHLHFSVRQNGSYVSPWDTKEAELEKTTKELAQAKIDVEKQYEDMKLRIKFMYENGTMSYIQILLSSGSFSELLNKAEYIEQVSEYDRNMLQTYQDNRDKITRLEKDLKDQKEVLEQVKGDVEAKQTEMAGLISDKQTEIEGYESDIQNKEEAIKEYEAMIAEQDSTIKALEASVAAAKAKRTQMTVSDNSTNAADQPHYGGGAFVWPAPSYTRISDDYGYRTHPILGIQKFHSGVDMAAPSGSSILAAADGTVVAATYNATMGNYVMIDHGNGLYTIYMHASALYVSSGQSVSAGSTIAAVGSTGRSTGAHLHFSVRQNGSYVSPWNYL